MTAKGNTIVSSLNEDTVFKVKADGKEITNSQFITSIDSQTGFQKVASAEIVFHDGGKTDDDSVIALSDELAIGKTIEIEAGDAESQDVIFKGVLVKQAVRLSKGTTEYVVTLKHNSYKMTLERKFRSFEDKTDKDIIRAICDEYGIDVDIDDTAVTHERLVQYNCTDWDFINMRAEANGLLLFTSLDGITAKAPVVDADPVISLLNDYSINDINLELDGRYSFDNFISRVWNYTSQELEEVSESGAQFDVPQGDTDSKQLTSLAGNADISIPVMTSCEGSEGVLSATKAQVLRNNLSRIVGEISIAGNSLVAPACLIDLQGIGKKFNGKTIISSVRHKLEPGQWETKLEVGYGNILYISKYEDISSYPANGEVAGVNGLQIAKVEGLEGDPLTEGRIYIKLLNDDNTMLWARVATMDAGNERGSFFLPEIGDEVIVGFIDACPNNAVVLGMLHSSQAPHPVEIKDDNHIKGFTTREKMVLEFDDEKKAIRIETPGGNKILVSEDEKCISLMDLNGNSIVMNDQGVNIESKKALNIKATQDITIEGANLNIKANAQLIAEGGASAEVSSKGTMVVKGGIVQIN